MATAPIPASPSPPPGWPQASFPAWPHDLESPEPPPAPPREPDSGPCLNWLFVDLNSYFASVRAAGPARAARPPRRRRAHDGRHHLLHRRQLRGQSLRRHTGTIVGRRQTHVPRASFSSRPATSSTPTTTTASSKPSKAACPSPPSCSIDEMACRLMGRERPLLAALDLGTQGQSSASARRSAPCCAAPSASPPTAISPRSPATWKSPTAWSPCPSTFSPEALQPAHPARPARHRRAH